MNPAQLGTLILEWTRLSDKKGNRDAEGEELFVGSAHGEVWPLWGIGWD